MAKAKAEQQQVTHRPIVDVQRLMSKSLTMV